MKHTETPWATDGTRIYRQANPGGRKYYLAETFGDVPCVERRSNAAHIVHCVNAHDGLVAALRKLDNYLYELQRANIIAGDLQRDLIRNALRAAGEEV